MQNQSKAVWSVEGLRRSGALSLKERDAAFDQLVPLRWTLMGSRLLYALAALCAALALFSLAAYNFTALMELLRGTVFWFLRLGSVVHVGLAAIPMLVSTFFLVRMPYGWWHNILSILSMALIVLPVIVAGQIYQIEANASGLFLLWFVFSLPLAIAARTKVAWVFSQVLAGLFLGFKLVEIEFYDVGPVYLIPAGGFLLWLVLKQWGPTWARNTWFPALNLVFIFGFCAYALTFDRDIALMLIGGLALFFGIVFVVARANSLLGGLSYLAVASLLPIACGRVMLDIMPTDDFGQLLVGSIAALIVIVWFVGAIVILLRLRARELNHD